MINGILQVSFTKVACGIIVMFIVSNLLLMLYLFAYTITILTYLFIASLVRWSSFWFLKAIDRQMQSKPTRFWTGKKWYLKVILSVRIIKNPWGGKESFPSTYGWLKVITYPQNCCCSSMSFKVPKTTCVIEVWTKMRTGLEVKGLRFVNVIVFETSPSVWRKFAIDSNYYKNHVASIIQIFRLILARFAAMCARVS